MGCINVELIAAHFVMNSVEETNFLLTNLFPDEQFPVHPLCILLPLKVLFHYIAKLFID